MYKVNHAPSHAHFFYPEGPLKEPLAVTELGSADHPAGYDTGALQKNSSALFYVISGKGIFNGTPFTAPAVIYMESSSPARYTVDSDCDSFFAYWIRFGGGLAEELLHEAGFFGASKAIPLQNTDRITKVFEYLTREESYTEADDRLFMLGGLYTLLSFHSDTAPQKEEKPISPYTMAVLEYIHTSYKKQLSEKDMASVINLSTNYMHKVFLSDTGTTPINYLNSYRIKCAKKLLKETNKPVSEIACLVGISGGDYFCRVFRKYSGNISPTNYRKQLKAGLVRND